MIPQKGGQSHPATSSHVFRSAPQRSDEDHVCSFCSEGVVANAALKSRALC